MTVFRDVPLDHLPHAHYGTIYADPSWGWLTYGKKNLVPQRAERQHYDSMTIDEIKALPVSTIAAKNCVLHMWVISSHVRLAMDIAEGWGFEFKSLGLNWVKTQKADRQAPKMGMGKWFRQESEISLLFTRGKPKRLSGGVRQVILEPAREHSRKPDAGIERVEALSDGPYLEMFSRSNREGWDSWGKEAGKFSALRGPSASVEPSRLLQAYLEALGRADGALSAKIARIAGDL